MFNKSKQEDTNEDNSNTSKWDDEDNTPITTNPIVLEKEAQEERGANTAAPKVARLTIMTNSGNDLLTQIKAARIKTEAVEVDEIKIQAVLDAQNIRTRKKEQEIREKNQQERQIAKLSPQKENDNDDLSSALRSVLTKRAAAIHGNDEDEDENDDW